MLEPERFLRAYTAFSRQYSPEQRAWPSDNQHRCSERCDVFEFEKIAFCRVSGNYHICTVDRCPYLQNAERNEARVCVLTGIRYASELDEQDVRYGGSYSRETGGPREDGDDVECDYAGTGGNDMGADDDVPPDILIKADEAESSTPLEPVPKQRGARKRKMIVDTDHSKYMCSGYLKHMDVLLKHSKEQTISEELRRYFHFTCVAFELIVKAVNCPKLQYDPLLHTCFVAYTLTTGFFHGQKRILTFSKKLRAILPIQKKLSLLQNVTCREYTRYSDAMLCCMGMAPAQMIQQKLGTLGDPPE